MSDLNQVTESALVDVAGIEKLLDRALEKCDSAKKDLDKLWIAQIVAVALSMALIVGLDEVVSENVIHIGGYGHVLDGIMPLLNLYYIMRFGFLAFSFSEARYAAQKFGERYVADKNLFRYFDASVDARQSKSVNREWLYSTNSFFEPLYSKTTNKLVYIYALIVPIVFGLSHSISIMLIVKLGGSHTAVIASLIVAYVSVLLMLYLSLYNALVKLEFNSPNMILFIDILSGILTIVFILLWIYRPIQLTPELAKHATLTVTIWK